MFIILSFASFGSERTSCSFNIFSASSLALTHKSLAADLTQTAIELLLLVAAK